MKLTTILSAVSIGAATMLANVAVAAPVLFCKDGAGSGNAAIDLVNLGCISGEARGYPGGGDGVYSNSGGGDPEADVEAAIFGAIGINVDISLYGKSDSNAALFNLTGMGGSSGTWSTVAGVVIRYITVKAANSFALYDVDGVSSGNWSTLGILNNGGNQPDVSHISFWTSDPPPSPVPLPAAGWLMLAGLGGLAALRKRKSA